MSIAENIARVRANIAAAAREAGREASEVTLVGASKMNDAEACRAAIAAGIDALGENREQEMTKKLAEHAYDGAPLHFIGHLQRNKVKNVVGKVALIQSVDSIGLLQEIEKRAAQHDCDVDILLQVNVAGEEQKSGIAYEDIDAFVAEMPNMSHVFLKGLMFIAPNLENKDDLRPYFKKMNDKFNELKTKNIDHVEMQWLSMGMSGDYDVAVSEGANMVRIGSAVFNTK